MKNKLGIFLANNWFTVVLAILPPIALWYFLERESTELAVTIESYIPVATVQRSLADGIQIFYQSKEVSSVDVTQISLENIGRLPIERADFESPIRFVFNAGEITAPTIVGLNPSSISPVITKDSSNSLLLEPLLLNPEDRFVFSTIVLDRLPSKSMQLTVLGRIRGIKQIAIEEASTEKTPSEYLTLLTALIGGLVSIVSFLNLFRQAKQIAIRFPTGLALKFAKELEQDKHKNQTVKRLADKLRISQHDYKANVMLLRIKIEGQLSELAHQNAIAPREQFGSISRLASTLRTRGILDQRTAAAIADVSPLINREMHAAESYLTDKEYAFLQNLSLSIVASLDERLRESSRQRK